MTNKNDGFNIIQSTINFGIIGCVSSGKSTLLNSLFCDTYSDMKIKRTTMIPQVYQCDPKINKNKNYAKEIRKKNEEINKKIIEQTENKDILSIQDCYEQVYKVSPIENFIKIPAYTNIVIFDIPGLNDSQTKNTYFSYLDENFYKFDYILFVIDIQQSLNTSDEMDILKLIRKNILDIKAKYNKDIKLLVVCNKCDNMDWNKESNQLEMDEEELEEMYQQIVKTLKNELTISYDIIKYSAEDTYIYRMLVNKNNLDIKYIDRIGINELGKKQWKDLKKESSSEELLKILQDKIDVNDRLKCTGYEGLIDKINKSIVSITDILISKINIIEEIIKKEKDYEIINIMFDNLYNFVKEIKINNKNIDINNIINNIKEYWHNILSSIYSFTIINYENHANIKKNYYEILIKQKSKYQDINFDNYIKNYKIKETDYFITKLDSIDYTHYTFNFNSFIQVLQNIFDNENFLPIYKINSYIYKIPIKDIHNLIILLSNYNISKEDACDIYIKYYINYDYNTCIKDEQPISAKYKRLLLSKLFMKEYISNNNINYSIISIIIDSISLNKSDLSQLGILEVHKITEDDIETFFKPFNIFIKFINLNYIKKKFIESDPDSDSRSTSGSDSE